MPRRKTTKTKKIQIGDKVLTYGEGKQVSDMMDSNDLYEQKDFESLRLKLERDGYLFIRGVIPQETILKARHVMLSQAAKDKTIVINDKSPLNNGRMFRKGTNWTSGYCVDGITGSETNQRQDIDIEAWQDIGPSDICKAVYNGEAIQTFWKQLFGDKSTKPLLKQTFLRLMGSSGTVQHADYYYFKRDTHIFTGDDGLNAQHAMKQYLQSNNLYNKDIYEVKEYENKDRKKGDVASDEDEVKEDELICGICGCQYDESELDDERRERLAMSTMKGNAGDFGMEGEWHCPQCAAAPLAIYTTWFSLSQLKAPKDSILAVIPESHKLQQWDLPLMNAQVPGDFNWKLKWVIPKSVDYGDIIIFNIKTIHASSLNVSSPRCFRCSFDTRLQLMPVDDVKDKENVNVMKKRRSRRFRKKNDALISPHPAKKVKRVLEEIDDEEEEEVDEHLSESIKSLHLNQD